MRKNVVIACLSVVLLLCAAGSAWADNRAMFADSHVQELYTSENGLLSTASTAIAQTSDGFVWIGGYGGLVRYDGKVFEPVFSGQLTSISELVAGDDGALWISSGAHGLSRYHNGELTWLSHEDDSGVTEITTLARDAQGEIWVGTTDGLMRVESGESIVALDTPELSGCYIRRLACLSDGRILCVCRDGRLFCYAEDGCKQVEKAQNARSACSGPDGTIYVGTTENRVYAFDQDFKLKQTLEFPELYTINALEMQDDGTLWVCADNGVAVYQDGGYRVQRLKLDNSVDRMMMDSEDNAWFASSRQGVLRVSHGMFENISQSAGLENLVVNAVQVMDGRIYIGHDDGFLVLDAQTYEPVDSPMVKDLEGVRVRSLHSAKDGDLWVATGGSGLLRYHRDGTHELYAQESHPAIQSDKFRCLYPSRDGMLAGTDMGAYLVRGKKVSNVLDNPDEMNCRVLSIASMGDTLYFGTDGFGLYMVRDGKVVGHITTDDGLTSNVIMKMWPGEELQGIWMITGNSVSFLDSAGKINSVGGFVSGNRLDILSSTGGRMMVLTGSDIYLTTERALLDSSPGDYRVLHYVDAIPYEITANSQQCLKDGALYFCGTAGVASLDLSMRDASSEDYQLVIDKVRIDNSQVADVRDSGRCELQSDALRLEIGAHVLTYRLDNPRVFYYLEGFEADRNEVNLDDFSTVSYTNLAGGSYVFHFGILDEETGQVKQETTLPIVKEYRWYERNSVRALMAALLVALIALVLYRIFAVQKARETRRLKAEYEQMERMHLEEMAYKDYLTGLYNRNYLDVWTSRELPKDAFPVTFISIDCNNLKKTNDTYGHKMGDKLLREMARILNEQFDDDRYTVVRLGGDEFLVMCLEMNEDEARRKVIDLREAAHKQEIVGIPITFSCGLSTMDAENFDFDECLSHSDLEMFAEKRNFHKND